MTGRPCDVLIGQSQDVSSSQERCLTVHGNELIYIAYTTDVKHVKQSMVSSCSVPGVVLRAKLLTL